MMYCRPRESYCLSWRSWELAILPQLALNMQLVSKAMMILCEFFLYLPTRFWLWVVQICATWSHWILQSVFVTILPLVMTHFGTMVGVLCHLHEYFVRAYCELLIMTLQAERTLLWNSSNSIFFQIFHCQWFSSCSENKVCVRTLSVFNHTLASFGCGPSHSMLLSCLFLLWRELTQQLLYLPSVVAQFFSAISFDIDVPSIMNTCYAGGEQCIFTCRLSRLLMWSCVPLLRK